MPVPAFSRHNRTISPPTISTTSTPARSKSTRGVSPPSTNTSYSPTVIPSGQQHRLNIVTRVAIEGKAKQGQDGASIKMYLKISVPLDTVTPGTTIPLFPEENVKILTSQVHPIDNTSVPYNFSSTVSPLLHNAARALNLPARSMDTYNTVFNLFPASIAHSVIGSNRTSKSTNGSSTSENIAPIDVQYTGHILVSGYHISYVLPKVFPNRVDGLPTDNEGEGFTRLPSRGRRPSVGERNTAQFMAAIDMWVPYVSRPPRSPYLLSLPTPRCLHNNIKLRIFPPTLTSSSFASLSSIEEDGVSWDLTSDPHVTRSTSNRPSRSNSYTHFADDESSDSSTAGFSDGCGIQGTFPSAERIRIRWAKPLRTIDARDEGLGSGRRRVGVHDVKGEMTCVVRGRGGDGRGGLVMDVEYKGTCKGVWFPGVATLLGMDVVLEAKGSDVSWAEGSPKEWVVAGGAGYTGFDVGVPRQAGPESRTSSLDSNSPYNNGVPSSSPQAQPFPASRKASTSSTSSLLRAPLPAQSVAEYSFEGSTATLASSSQMGTVSSMSSLAPASTDDSLNTRPRPPGVPTTLHINMNEITLPAKNVFTFTISGTVVITARPTLSRPNGQSSNSSPTHSGTEHDDADPEPIVLPRFTVLAADSESTSITVRNEIEGVAAIVEVYNSTGDIYRDAQARKTVLQKGSTTKCAEGGGRVAFKSLKAPYSNIRPTSPATHPRAPTGHGLPRIPSNSSLGRMIYPPRPKRDGPLMIPSVVATVIPLIHKDTRIPNGYTVRISLNAPADTDSEWLEFGLAKFGGSAPLLTGNNAKTPAVMIISASVEGVPVKSEMTAATRQETNGLGVPFEELNGQEWVSWVKVHVGAVGGGAVVIEYVVNDSHDEASRKKGKARATDDGLLHVFLPTFSLPVGRLDVDINTYSGVELISLQSNFAHEMPTPNGYKLLQYSLEEFFYPHLSLAIRPKSVSKPSSLPGLLPLVLMTWVMFLAGAILALRLSSKFNQMTRSLEDYSAVAASGWNTMPEPVTVTTTVYTTTGTRGWFGDMPTETRPGSAPSTPIASAGSAEVSSPDEIRRPNRTPSPLASRAKDTELSLSPSPSATEAYSLLPIQNILSFSWPIQDFDIHATLDKALQAFEVVWQLFRKVYHYPLEPA